MKFLYALRGKVREGHKRGKRLGFPTANVLLHQQIPEGIYVASVTYNKKTYNALTFIGSAKTFEEREYKSETFILHFNQDIYSKWITIYLYKKLRKNKKFVSEEQLITNMNNDLQRAEKFFRDNII